MKGIIVNIRNEADCTLETVRKSGNRLIAMLEDILSEKTVAEKKQILKDEYGMIMTEELEGRMRDMCNLSELVEERGAKRERIDAIKRMLKANFTKDQIISCGYTEEGIERAESRLYANV